MHLVLAILALLGYHPKLKVGLEANDEYSKKNIDEEGGIPLSSSFSLLLKNSFRMETTPWIVSGFIFSCGRGAIMQTVHYLCCDVANSADVLLLWFGIWNDKHWRLCRLIGCHFGPLCHLCW